MTAASASGAPAWRPPAVPIRVGLVGLGNVAVGHHLPALLGMGDLVKVVAIADPSEERRRLVLQTLEIEPTDAYALADGLLARDDVDVVDLATPPHVRTPLALAAIAAGHAVLCEKPLATRPADALAIARASAGSGVPVAVIHNYLRLPEIVAARAAIDEGAIGEPEVAILDYLGVEDRPGSRSWNPSWRHDAAVAGGGVLMDMLHVVYVAEALLGRPFRRVSADVLARARDAPVEDIALCRYETDTAIALVNVGWGVGPGGIAVSGPDGRIEIGYAGGGTGPFAPLATVHLTRADGRVEDRTPPLPVADGTMDVRFAETLREVFDGLARARPPVASAADGLRVLEATLGAYASATQGRTVELPLAEDDPVHLRGIEGLADLPLAAGGWISRRGMFGIHGKPRGAM